MTRVSSRVALAGYGDHRYFGASLFEELLGEETVSGMIALSVGGRRLDADERATLDDLAVALSVADPRIWPLKLTRLVASYGGTIAGFAAGQLCLEGDLIGLWPSGVAAANLVELAIAAASCDADGAPPRDAIVRWLASKKRLVGYGIPFRELDERLEALRPRLAARGRTRARYWRLMEELSRVVHAERGLRPNIVVAAAALLLDMGFSPEQVGAIGYFLNVNVFVAHAFEGATQRAAPMRELPAEAIDYVGRPPRTSPRAR